MLKRDPFRTTYGLFFYPTRKKYKIKSQKFPEGFDTETDKGKCKVIADSTEWREVNSMEEILKFLGQHKRTKTLNLFFNLTFDFEVMFKYDKNLLKALMENPDDKEACNSHGYLIKYIKGKLFSMRTPKHDTISFYDISQFYNTSLAHASLKYLGLKTHELKGDRAKLFQLHSVDRIGEYCQDDCEKTKLLGGFILQKFGEIGVQPDKLYSCGYVAQMYSINHANLPHFFDIPRPVQEYYWKAYRGGWFDTYKKGIFKADSYDLKSAYPWALSLIPDPTGCKWKHYRNKKFFDEDDIGVLKVVVYGRTNFSPLAVATQGRSIYPMFDKGMLYYMTIGEYLQLSDHYDIKILDGYYLEDISGPRPYEVLCKKLFTLKESAKDDIGLYDTVKKIINSLYGKTAQINKDSRTGGRLFNPYFAAECTARCRIRMHQAIEHLQDEVISIMTDGILLEKGTRIKGPKGKELGQFNKEISNKNTIIVETGVYEPEGGKIKTRGFTKKKILFDKKGKPYVNKDDTISLFDLLDTKQDKIKVWHFRPRHFRECIIQEMYDKIGVFEAIDRELDLNGDLKRIWPIKIVGRDLLTKQLDSTPVPSSLFTT